MMYELGAIHKGKPNFMRRLMAGQNESSTRKCILSNEKILTWHEKTLGRMFYPLSGQENCFSLAALGLKQPFSFPTIGKNNFLPLVFPCLAKFFHMTGIYIFADCRNKVDTSLLTAILRRTLFSMSKYVGIRWKTGGIRRTL